MLKQSIAELLKPVSIDFREEEHSYVNRDTGMLYTGTTTISGAWKKDFLAPWHAKEAVKELGYFDPRYDKEFTGLTREAKKLKVEAAWKRVEEIRAEIVGSSPQAYYDRLEQAKGAAKRLSELAKDNGHIAHAWIEKHIKSYILQNQVEGTVVPLPNEVEAANAVRAFLGWELENQKNVEWLGSEEVVCSDIHKVGGTLDALLNYNSLLTIGDIKTSSQISEDYLLQLAGYDIQLAELGLQARQWLIIRTPKDGSPAETLTINEPKFMQFARDTFLRQREAHKFYVYAENKLKVGEGFQRKMKVDTKTEEIKVA